IEMGDPAGAGQLISGFYSVESGSWRWTARQFSAVFGTPEDARAGATLTVHLFIPEAQLRLLGPVRLRAAIRGHALGEQKFFQPGDAVYSRSVSPVDLEGPFTVVTFSFDKAAPPTQVDGRELGAIVKSAAVVARVPEAQ